MVQLEASVLSVVDAAGASVASSAAGAQALSPKALTSASADTSRIGRDVLLLFASFSFILFVFLSFFFYFSSPMR